MRFGSRNPPAWHALSPRAEFQGFAQPLSRLQARARPGPVRAAVGPSPEVCGNGADENCNGIGDEGCACKAVAPGAGGSFAVTGRNAKLVAHGTLAQANGRSSPSFQG